MIGNLKPVLSEVEVSKIENLKSVSDSAKRVSESGQGDSVKRKAQG